MINRPFFWLLATICLLGSCTEKGITTLELRGKVKDKFRCGAVKYNEKYEALECNAVEGSSIIKFVEVFQDFRQLNANFEAIRPLELAPARLSVGNWLPRFEKIGKKNYIIVEERNFGGTEYSRIVPSCLDGIMKPDKRLTIKIMGDEAANMIIKETGKKIVWEFDAENGILWFFENEIKRPREAIYASNGTCGVKSQF